jgi:hypothetical protein
MDKRRFIKIQDEEQVAMGKKERSCCSTNTCVDSNVQDALSAVQQPLVTGKGVPEWIVGSVETPSVRAHKISTEWSKADYWGEVKSRVSAFRMKYSVSSGLYAVGDPDEGSDVLVTANYKLSFDMLRRELRGINAWILVMDTRGINVWCAAGKGTFGTYELIKLILDMRLDTVVKHRRIILPQLSAPGVNARQVKQKTGFRVFFGPVYARDIPAYIRDNYDATKEMRTVKFTMFDRLVLTPMELNPVLKKFPVYALIIFMISGLQPAGILFKEAWYGGLPFLLLGLLSVIAGAFITPVLLPFVPFRSFAVKGWIVGMLTVFLSLQFLNIISQTSALLIFFIYLFFPIASSYIALQFTGSTTYTGISGVKKELRIAIPVYTAGIALSVVILTIYKIREMIAA